MQIQMLTKDNKKLLKLKEQHEIKALNFKKRLLKQEKINECKTLKSRKCNNFRKEYVIKANVVEN